MENLINGDAVKRNMKSARVKAGYTQTTAANALGVTKTTLCNWEKNPAKLKFEKFIRLAQLYGVNVSYFFGA